MTQARPGLADGVDWRLYYVTDTALSGGPDKVPHLVEQAVLGGAGVVQIRDKDLPGHEFLTLAKACAEAAHRAQDQTGRPVALVVNGAKVTTDAGELAKVAVTGEVLEHTKGPKIRIHKFKNKTGYHKRQGHRQQLTVLKVTGIK